MLVLSRRQYESIRIGDSITITFLGLKKGTNTARLGIEAPKEVPVHRDEVYQEIQREKDA